MCERDTTPEEFGGTNALGRTLGSFSQLQHSPAILAGHHEGVKCQPGMRFKFTSSLATTIMDRAHISQESGI